MNDLFVPCKECGNIKEVKSWRTKLVPKQFFIHCGNCGNQTKGHETLDAAVKAWNKGKVR